jgi:hypothetical protein
VSSPTLHLDTQLGSHREESSGAGTLSPTKTPPGSADSRKGEEQEHGRRRKKRLQQVVERSVRAMELNYLRINQQFEAMIAQNQALLASPRSLEQEQVEEEGGKGGGDEEQKQRVRDRDRDKGAGVLQQQTRALAARRERRREQKKDILLLLASSGSASATFAVPRWRLQLEAESRDTPDTSLFTPVQKLGPVLGGKRLFRLVARLVLHFYAKPVLNVRRRQLETRAARQQEFHRASEGFFESCSAWLGRVVQVPLASLRQVSASVSE